MTNNITTNKKPILTAFPLAGRRNWHYEVISFCIWDNSEVEEYFTLEHAERKGLSKEQLAIKEDDIPEGVSLTYRYECSSDDKINIYNAKRSDLGIIRVIEECEHKGREFMFPLYDKFDVNIQMLLYGFLTHGYVDKQLIKQIKKDKVRREYLRILAKGYYDSIMEMADFD